MSGQVCATPPSILAHSGKNGFTKNFQDMLECDVPLGPLTWFRTGGAADLFFKPRSLLDLQGFLKVRPRDLPYSILGAGSNILVREGGVRGVVFTLPKDCGMLSFAKDGIVLVGAKVLDKKVAKEAALAGLSGLEFLYTIPGTIGGALRMNAGAFGREMKDVLIHALALDPEGRLHQLSPKDMGLGYRHCRVPEDWVFVGAALQGTPGKKEDILETMEELAEKRRTTQPSGLTGGSTFKNPVDGNSDPYQKAWALIDKAGMRGAHVGDAWISEHHCNFMLNKGKATAADLETLGENVRKEVEKDSGVRLVWEIVRWGEQIKA